MSKLQVYEQALKRFEYKQCLNKALADGNPEVVVALFEELVERGALYTAIGSRSEQELEELMTFLVWKIADHRFSNVLLDVTRITIEMYSGVLGLASSTQKKLEELEKVVIKQVELSKGLLALNGQIDMLKLILSSQRH